MKSHTYALLLFFVCLFTVSQVHAQEVDIFSLEGSISSTYSNSYVKSLIDNTQSTDFNFTGLPNDIVYASPKTYAVTKFTLISSSQADTKDPKEFELSGSLDGINWTIIRNITSFTFTSRNQVRTLSINSSQPYSFFRLRIKAVADAGESCSLSEWRLMGEERILAQPPSDVRANPLTWESVRLSWRDRSTDEDNFEVQRSTNGVDFITLATLLPNTTYYTDNSVNSNAFYIYRVSSVKNRGRSVQCVSNGITTPKFPLLNLLTAGRQFSVTEPFNTSPAGEGISCAFDDDVNTKFLARSSTIWMRIGFNESLTASQYSITSANDSPSRDPKNWRLEASNDGVNWTVLDSRENQSFDKRFQKRYFQFENTEKYLFYRLNVTRNNGDGFLTQLADWLLYGNVQAGTDVITPDKPNNFQLENRAYHHVKLSWNDVANETGYRIYRSEDGGQTFAHTYEIPANNTESYPYSLKPETSYLFKLCAVNGGKESTPEYVSVTTGKKDFIEQWDNLSLWIFDAPITVKKVKQIGDVAFYMPLTNAVEDVDELYYQFYAANWEHVYNSYAEELSDSRLFVMLFPMEEGGGLASIFDYRSSGGNYTNMVYIKANKNWFKSPSQTGYIYDVMAHELCHIVEGVGGGYNGSMYYPIWGDSKWAEILQYDVFDALGSPRAATWHSSYTAGNNPSGGAEYPNSSQTSYWYRDFFYPTYINYGKTDLLKKFWKLQGQHYRMRNGSFQGNSTNPGGRGNLGEFIHFWSGAAGVDVKKYAMQAFGWNEQFEAWLQQAKIDYPEINYSSSEIDNGYVNICQNKGVIKSNYLINGIKNFIDNSYTTYYVVRRNNAIPTLELSYSSTKLAKIDKYTIVSRDNEYPKSWKFYGSNDENEWVLIDEQTAPAFENNKIVVNLSNTNVYKHYKFDFDFGSLTQVKFAEFELWGIEHDSAPYDLATSKINEESVYLDWSSKLDEIDSYELERSIDGVSFTKIADVSRYDISFTDLLQEPGEYYYRLGMINLNKAKEKVYSNIAYINTLLSSAKNTISDSSAFVNIAMNLHRYPENEVDIYSMTGQKIHQRRNLTGDLTTYVNSKLSTGTYIVKIKLGQDGTSVIGKIFVK